MDLAVCRICLRADIKLLDINKYNLLFYYEEIVVNRSCPFPSFLCYECACLLNKHHTFNERCKKSAAIMLDLHWKGKLNYSDILLADKTDIKSSLNFQKCQRVGEYNIEYIDTPVKEEEEKHVEVHFSIENPDFVELEKLDDLASTDIKQEDEIHDYDIQEDYNDFNATDSDSSDQVLTKLKAKKNKKKKILKKIEKKKKVKRKESSELPAFDKFLKNGNWKKFTLTQEEAEKAFKDRAKDKRYTSSEFKCTDCLKYFSREEILKRHQSMVHFSADRKHSCPFCKTVYKFKSKLTKHMLIHYTRYECLRCQFVCAAENSANLHDASHGDINKTCKFCGKNFRHLSTYYTHLRVRHRSEHICETCGASFVSDIGLNNHKKKGKCKNDDKNQSIYCEKCNISFKSQVAYDEHIYNSSLHKDDGWKKPIMDIDNLSWKGSVLKTGVNTGNRNRKPTDCIACGESFPTQSLYVKHHHAAHPRTPLNPHLKYICQFCGASLAPGSVASHLNIHTKEKAYTCDICERVFYAYTSWKRHSLTHTGEKPFPCTLCDKRFTQPNSMKLHYRTFHLKEPYPKRNRSKKNKEADDDVMGACDQQRLQIFNMQNL